MTYIFKCYAMIDSPICKPFFTAVYRKMSTYDCIISGGGMIGSTLACSLASTPLLKNNRILLIEAGSKKEWKSQSNYSNRVSALNNSSVDLMKNNGMWNNIELARYQTVNRMRVWGHCSNNNIDFYKSHDDNMAFIVENDVIINSAHKALESATNVDILYNAQVKEVTFPQDESSTEMPAVKLDNDSTYFCQLLVGADGEKSKVRASLNPHHMSWSYDQAAVVATVNVLTVEPNTTAWQRFLSEGPVALLPLTANKSSLVWSTTKQKANDLLQLSSEDFVDALNHALVSSPIKEDVVSFARNGVNSALSSLKFVTDGNDVLPPFIKSVDEMSRAAFPLGFSHCTTYIGPKVALIGDAAHRVHPLAGQGVNLGFSDIKYLTAALKDGIKHGRKLGDLLDLKIYEKNSQCHNVPMMISIDLLHKIYTSDSKIMKAIGDISLQITEAVTPIKKTMQKFAAGNR